MDGAVTTTMGVLWPLSRRMASASAVVFAPKNDGRSVVSDSLPEHTRILRTISENVRLTRSLEYVDRAGTDTSSRHLAGFDSTASTNSMSSDSDLHPFALMKPFSLKSRPTLESPQ